MYEPAEGHTVKRLDNDLQHLAALLTESGDEVVAQLRAALAAFRLRDIAKALQITALVQVLDRIEQQANTQIMQVLARWCPHGSDLRLILAIHRGIAVLEHIGDETLRIADLVEPWSEGAPGGIAEAILADVDRLGDLAVGGLKGALAAFEHGNATGAAQAVDRHRELHEALKAGLRVLTAQLRPGAAQAESALTLVLLLQALDRIGQLSRTLAEDLILRASGEDGPVTALA